MSGQKTATDDEIASVKEQMLRKLGVLRHQVLMQMPFIGSIAMRLDLIVVRDYRCSTACTNGKSIFFDMEFFAGLSDQERLFVLLHEVWHNVMLHFLRRQGRDVDLFNIATDMEVNNILKSEAKNIRLPSGVLLPPDELRGSSAEAIYEWLQKNRPDAKDFRKFDQHVYSDKSGESDSDQDGSESSRRGDRWGEVGVDKDFNVGIDENTGERIREAVVSAAQRYTREHGSLPAGIEQLVEKLAHPQVDWRQKLCQFVTKSYGDSREWCPPNRRHVYNDMYFPSRRGKTINIGVFIDTSGSTVADLPQFFGEFKGLVDSFSNYVVHCIQCDARVDKYERFDDCNPFDPHVGSGVSAAGGGGTDLTPPFEYVAENGFEIDCAVYMTDGYADKPRIAPPPYPVLWLISNGGTASAVGDFGEVVFLKKSQF